MITLIIFSVVASSAITSLIGSVQSLEFPESPFWHGQFVGFVITAGMWMASIAAGYAVSILMELAS